MTEPLRLAADHTVWSVRMENSDSWDSLYTDEQTALAAAAAEWTADEYGQPDPGDPDRATPSLTWTKRYNRWELADEGRDTGIRVAPVSVYRPATADETCEPEPEHPGTRCAGIICWDCVRTPAPNEEPTR